LDWLSGRTIDVVSTWLAKHIAIGMPFHFTQSFPCEILYHFHYVLESPISHSKAKNQPGTARRRKLMVAVQVLLALLSFGRFIGQMDEMLEEQLDTESGIAITGVDAATGQSVLSFTWRYRDVPVGIKFATSLPNLLTLDFQAFWGRLERVHSTAQVNGLSGITLTPVLGTNGSQFDVAIEHLPSKEGCHLTCLKTGETSRGPCITCKTGRHSVRICC
jgi:hypothetical protein